jgi:hypothetical protein
MDSDDKIKFHEIYLRLTDAQFEDWSESAKLKNQSLVNYIINSTEGQVLKSEILGYLEKQAKSKAWWEKKTYIL